MKVNRLKLASIGVAYFIIYLFLSINMLSSNFEVPVLAFIEFVFAFMLVELLDFSVDFLYKKEYSYYLTCLHLRECSLNEALNKNFRDSADFECKKFINASDASDDYDIKLEEVFSFSKFIRSSMIALSIAMLGVAIAVVNLSSLCSHFNNSSWYMTDLCNTKEFKNNYLSHTLSDSNLYDIVNVDVHVSKSASPYAWLRCITVGDVNGILDFKSDISENTTNEDFKEISLVNKSNKTYLKAGSKLFLLDESNKSNWKVLSKYIDNLSVSADFSSISSVSISYPSSSVNHDIVERYKISSVEVDKGQASKTN